jgi:hypothetical protein
MQNAIPKSPGLLAGLGIKVLAGLNALAVILGITQMPPDTFEADLDAFNGSNNVYNTARSAQRIQSDLYVTAMATLTGYLKASRAVLVASFGNRWNTLWAQAGFVQPSTGVPSRNADKLALALSLIAFFTANPSYEVAAKNVTAAQGTILRSAVITAQNNLQPKKVATRTAHQGRATAQGVLTAAIRMVIKVLSGTIGPNDPRWEQFGLNMPGVNTTPAAPTGLAATPMGTSLLLTCDAVANATRYRFRRKIVGVDIAYKLVGSATEPMVMLEDLAPGVTMELIAQAVNGPSQGKACDPITVTMPPAGAPEVVLPASLGEVVASTAPASNGKSERATSRVS